MSDQSTDSRPPRSSGGARRSGSGSGRRRGNKRGGQQSGRRQGGPQNRHSNAAPRRQPRPVELTFWQKFLKAIGLYDPNKPPKRTSPSRVPKPEGTRTGAAQKSRAEGSGKQPKSRTRNVRSAKPVETNRLYVGNLSYDATEHDLEDLFKGTGTVSSVEIVYNRNTHRSKGYAFIEMGSIEEAKRAVETLHDQSFMDRNLIVSGAKSKGPADGDEDSRDEGPSDPEDDREDRDSEEAA